jgi:dihydroorotase
MTPAVVQDAFEQGFDHVKYYPEGVTTNSSDGIHPDKLEVVYPVLEAMEKLGMVLCIHGEHPDHEVLDREKAFVPILADLARRFDGLKMVFEHVSSAEGVEAVCALPDNVAATVTVHHLGSTLTDMLGGDLEPHMNCKPVIKNKLDRQVIQNVVFSGHPKFALGSDSAGHPRDKKETSCCAAGAFTAPILLPMLAQLFYENSALDNLEAFTSLNGARFRGYEPNQGRIALELREGEPFEPEVPEQDIVTFPFRRDPESKEPMKFNWHVVDEPAA